METQDRLTRTERELKIRNYSRATIKAYLYGLREYFAFLKQRPDVPNTEMIKDFLLAMERRGISPATRNLFLNAIKFYYHSVINAAGTIDIRLAKKNKCLPAVLSRSEIHKILKVTNNRKHRLLLALAYGAGLRVSEVVNLRIGDLQLDELIMHIKQAKGRKDRITVIPARLVPALRTFTTGRGESDVIFASERGGQLTTRTAQKIFETGLYRAGIPGKATFHSLRHSFATHLLEDGTDIRYVQELLGHNNIRTTQRYTHVTNPSIKNIKSPLG